MSTNTFGEYANLTVEEYVTSLGRPDLMRPLVLAARDRYAKLRSAEDADVYEVFAARLALEGIELLVFVAISEELDE